MNKIIIFLLSTLISISIFGVNHKIAIDARNYLANEIDLTRPIAQKTKTIFDTDTSDNAGGGEWSIQITESGSLATAVEAANNYGAEKLIIIRMNNFDGTANGTETYARDTNATETDLANKVQSNVATLLGLNNRGVKNTTGDNTANMDVILHYPGFMDNTNDYNTLSSTTGQENIAKGILFGLQEHFGLAAYDPNAIHDTTPPVITITSPTDGQIVNNSNITVSGSITDNIGVSLVKINNTEVTLSGDLFSKNITLSEGSNSIEVYAEDSSGNNVSKVINVTYTVLDNNAPNIAIAYPSYNSTVAVQNINIKGSVRDNDSGVKYFKIDGANISLNANGGFSYPVVLNHGLNTFQLEASDNNDNVSHQDLKVNYEEAATDTTPPVISVISPNNNDTVNTQQINIQGSVYDDSQISLFTINGRNISLNNNNEFNFELTLSEGSNEIKFYARDEFNNQVNKIINITYRPNSSDTTPPIITITNYQNGDKVTTENITILGKITDNNEVTSLKINSNSIPLSVTGKFSYNAILVIGENKFEFEALDGSNNKTTKSLSIYLESHQNSGPEIIIISPKDSSVINQDNVDIKGTVKDSDGIKYLSINNSIVNSNIDGTFSVNYPLILGSNELTISAEDNIGNKSEVKLTIIYRIIKPKKDDGGCNFQDNSNKNFTNLYILLIMLLVLYFRRRWIKKIN